MDATTFDRITKLLGATPSRRATLGLIATIAAQLTNLPGGQEAEAKNKKKWSKKKRHKKKKHRDEPKGEFCGDRYCEKNQRCCGAQCVDPGECCERNSDCNPCELCNVGLCVPDPTKNGKACNGCLECVNGACGIPNDDFCPDGQKCRSGNGVCCPACVNDKCCPAGSACINPGLFSDNFCCDMVRNTPCGRNSDGTFRQCCSTFNERCVDGECVPKETCEGDLTAQGLCCPEGTVACAGLSGPFCAPAGHTCCGDASCDESQVCCDPSQSVCCAKGSCAEGQCCTGGRTVCDGKCVDTQTDRRHCRRCGWTCDAPGFDCCAGSCVNLMTDEENCGACGNVCNARGEVCVEGQCREICSLNQPPWQNACDDGIDHWCCPDGSTTCCRLSGQPHCC
jgi:hypothetical protein